MDVLCFNSYSLGNVTPPVFHWLPLSFRFLLKNCWGGPWLFLLLAAKLHCHPWVGEERLILPVCLTAEKANAVVILGKAAVLGRAMGTRGDMHFGFLFVRLKNKIIGEMGRPSLLSLKGTGVFLSSSWWLAWDAWQHVPNLVVVT